MGLTIQYSLATDAKRAADVRRFLKSLREEALKLPFAQVSKLAHFVGPEADCRRTPAEAWRWFLIQARGHVPDPKHPDHSYSVAPIEVYGFRAWPGEGCEEANVGLALYPDRVGRADGTSIPTRLDGWRWAGFTKTQYASDPRSGGIMNFLRCHLAVIALLDAAGRSGLKVQVDDGGGYWKGRDVRALAQEVGQWNSFVAALGGAMKDRMETAGLTVAGAIFGRPDFEHLEAAGVKDPVAARVIELIRKTGRPAGSDERPDSSAAK